MALSEIEKLERRYAENPQGLTFAPLAEVHRKNGDVARALELLRPGLELHPDYVPASIVLGRCHWDLGNLAESEAAFAHVLELDGENVIALKALADISERQHRLDDAERWLRQLLGVDRSNDEAQVQLERIAAARSDAALSPQPPAVAVEEPAIASEPEPLSDSKPEPAPEAEPAAVSSAAERAAPEFAEEAPLALEDLEPRVLADEEVEPPPPGLEVEEPPVVEEEVEPLAGLVGRDVDQPETVEPEFRVETSEDIVLQSSGGHEFQMPDAAQELTSGLIQPSPFADAGLDLPEPSRPEAAPPAPEAVEAPEPPAVAEAMAPAPTTIPEAVPMPEEPAVPDEPVSPGPPVAEQAPPAPSIEPVVVAPEPEPVVTESMAEVLLQQGHATEALHVYRELDARSPGDGRIRQRIAELEEAERLRATEPAPARRKYTAAETGGRSVGELLRGILSQRLPASGAPAPRALGTTPEGTGAPTRPAPDALSLSSVFGDEGSPLPPAVPTAGAPPAGGVSYDEFFGQPGSSGGTAKPRAADPKGDDLDQFHAWLQNLKR